MAERVGLSNVVHRDCDQCNPDSIPTDGHGKPVFWAKYACTVIIWFSDKKVSVLDLKQFEFLSLANETPKLSLVLCIADLARARGSLLTNTNTNINHQTHQRNCKKTPVDFRKFINLTVWLGKPFTPFSILITS
jgi:hypothetical protein